MSYLGKWFIGNVADVSDALASGRITITHKRFGIVPCDAAAMPGDFSAPGEGDQVMFGCFEDAAGEERYVWSQQVYGRPDFESATVQTSVQGKGEPITPDPDDGLPESSFVNTRGNLEFNKAYLYDALPGRKVFTDKKGNKLIFSTKSSKGQGSSKFVKLRSTKDKRLILDDNPSLPTRGIHPRGLPNPANPGNSKYDYKSYGNRILLIDENDNRVHIDSSEQKGENYARSGWTTHVKGGDIVLDIANINSMGDMRIKNRARGDTFLSTNQGSMQSWSKTGFSLHGQINPLTSLGVGIEGATAPDAYFATPDFLKAPTLPTFPPSLTLGVGATATTLPEDPNPSKLVWGPLTGWMKLDNNVEINAPLDFSVTAGKKITLQVGTGPSISVDGLTGIISIDGGAQLPTIDFPIITTVNVTGTGNFGAPVYSTGTGIVTLQAAPGILIGGKPALLASIV
jgi:hypothetical protein